MFVNLHGERRQDMVSREEVLEVLKNVEDPELAFGIVDLGLVYRIDVRENAIEVDRSAKRPLRCRRTERFTPR